MGIFRARVLRREEGLFILDPVDIRYGGQKFKTSEYPYRPKVEVGKVRNFPASPDIENLPMAEFR